MDQHLKVLQPAIPPDIVDWSHNFFVPETKASIKLEPVQKAVLREFFRVDGERFRYTTGLYSTIKKSGKTTIGAMVMQWASETWGEYLEIYHMGNKLGQAKERAFKILRRSIELSGSDKWDLSNSLDLVHIPTCNTVKPLPINAAGEAGGNQSLTVWTEIHGYVHEESLRMWSEMQPVPTQRLSFRFAESYAGYEGESDLLRNLWDLALEGERVHDEFPIYANGGLVAYIDTGKAARRMPWQTDAYYARAAAEELPDQYRRLHLNEWVSSQNTFVPIEWWASCKGQSPPLTANESLVVGVDAAVSGDCFAIVGVSRRGDTIHVRFVRVWEPPQGGKINFADVEQFLIDICQQYRVAQICYDPYQLHQMMTNLRREAQTWIKEFNQGVDRLKADKALYDRIRDGRIVHAGEPVLTDHIEAANSKIDSDESRLRIVKASPLRKIDAAVALSMAAYRSQKLNIG